MNPTPQHEDTTLDEILADFSDGIAAEQAWVDARQALLQWRDKAVVEARIDECENTTSDADERLGYKDTYKEDRLEELKSLRKSIGGRDE